MMLGHGRLGRLGDATVPVPNGGLPATPSPIPSGTCSQILALANSGTTLTSDQAGILSVCTLQEMMRPALRDC